MKSERGVREEGVVREQDGRVLHKRPSEGSKLLEHQERVTDEESGRNPGHGFKSSLHLYVTQLSSYLLLLLLPPPHCTGIPPTLRLPPLSFSLLLLSRSSFFLPYSCVHFDRSSIRSGAAEMQGLKTLL